MKITNYIRILALLSMTSWVLADGPTAAPLAQSTNQPGDTPYFAIRPLGLNPYVFPAQRRSQALVTLTPSDLSAVRAFPNPWRSDRHAGLPVTFDHLATNSTIKIFTISGHWIKTLPTSNAAVTWDLTNDSGQKVASGVYIYLISTNLDQKTRGLLAVIK